MEKEFRIQLRQPITKGMIDTVNSLCKGYSSITVDTLSGTNNPLFSIHLSHCECIGHSFKLDYSDADIAVHNLVFKYSFLQEIDPVEQKEV